MLRSSTPFAKRRSGDIGYPGLVLSGLVRICRLPAGRTLAGAIVGLLAGTAFQPAVASADDYAIDPIGPAAITGIYGYAFAGSASPATPGSIQAAQDFLFTDTTTGSSGEFAGLENNWTDVLGDVNQLVYVASDSSDDGPAAGSLFDAYSVDDGRFVNLYTDITSPSGDVVTDTLKTPFGTFTIPIAFDAADLEAADAGGVPIQAGSDLDPVGSLTVNALTGVPPVFIAYQGTQNFDVEDGHGGVLGSFEADDTATEDEFGIHTEAVLVTKDLGDAPVGTAVGDTPAVGSIFNTTALGGFVNAYSDLVGTSGNPNVIVDTLVTPWGDFEFPVTLDAAQAEITSVMQLPDGQEFDPIGNLVYTGVNGLPPAQVAVQGTQVFEIDGSATNTFTADVSNTLDEFGDSSETLLVTSSADPAVPVGSVYEVATFGDIDIENIYTDIVSASGGPDVITDTLVTPFGDYVLPSTLDLAASSLINLFQSL